MKALRSLVLLLAVALPCDAFPQVFAGSTPCNKWINALLGIAPSDTCVFMRWELQLAAGKDSVYLLTISYGDYLPNTLHFLNGGKTITLRGRLRTGKVSRNHTPYIVMHLLLPGKNAGLRLLRLDENLLHLLDEHYELLKGDESFGFALYRISISSPQTRKP